MTDDDEWLNQPTFTERQWGATHLSVNTHLCRKYTREHAAYWEARRVNNQVCKGVLGWGQVTKGTGRDVGGITGDVPRPHCNPLLGYSLSLLKGAPECMYDPDFPFSSEVCCLLKDCLMRISPVVQWLRLCASTAWGTGSIPARD